MENELYNEMRAAIAVALIDNGGPDWDLMTRTKELDIADFIMEYIRPLIAKHDQELVDGAKADGIAHGALAERTRILRAIEGFDGSAD